MLTLTALRDHLAERRQASLGEIATHFDADPDVVREALGRFEAKGRVRRLPAGEACGGCSCGCRGGDVWEWSDRPAPRTGGGRDRVPAGVPDGARDRDA